MWPVWFGSWPTEEGCQREESECVDICFCHAYKTLLVALYQIVLIHWCIFRLQQNVTNLPNQVTSSDLKWRNQKHLRMTKRGRNRFVYSVHSFKSISFHTQGMILQCMLLSLYPCLCRNMTNPWTMIQNTGKRNVMIQPMMIWSTKKRIKSTTTHQMMMSSKSQKGKARGQRCILLVLHRILD